jgi:hypothetical protein
VCGERTSCVGFPRRKMGPGVAGEFIALGCQFDYEEFGKLDFSGGAEGLLRQTVLQTQGGGLGEVADGGRKLDGATKALLDTWVCDSPRSVQRSDQPGHRLDLRDEAVPQYRDTFHREQSKGLWLQAAG